MYPATHRRLGPNQQALRMLWFVGVLAALNLDFFEK
jgi:hypothetical protein